MTNLQTMTNAELVDHHNSLGPDAPLKNWKGKKSDLLVRIAALQPTSGRTIRECALDLLCRVAFHEDRTVEAGSENVVDSTHEHARSVGIPYNEVIDGILEEFPACNTTVACLRWYAVKVRAQEEGYENYVLPQRRPRAKAA